MKFFIFLAIVGLAIFLYLPIELVSVNLEVLDERGKPVEDAQVRMGFLGGGPHVSGKRTDAEGQVSATRVAKFGVKIYGEKDGYYDSKIRTGYGDQDIKMVLKRKINPIPMYSKKLYIEEPKKNTKFGYDLIKGDYVKPYGSGEISDFVLNIDHTIRNDSYTEYHLSVSFSNPGDGLISFYKKVPESTYISSYKAPISGYRDNWDFYLEDREGSPRESNFDYDRNYYFRVRTEVDRDGDIKNAHYGKIYGEFPEFTYYINPAPNDRNVEFDTDKNLFTDLDYVVFNP